MSHFKATFESRGGVRYYSVDIFVSVLAGDTDEQGQASSGQGLRNPCPENFDGQVLGKGCEILCLRDKDGQGQGQ